MNTIIVNKSIWPIEKHWKELKQEREAVKELLTPKKKPRTPSKVVFNDESYEDAMKRIVNSFKGHL